MNTGTEAQEKLDIIRELFENNYYKVYRTAFSILYDRDIAYDATNETFLKAFKGMDTIKDIGRFEAWVQSIARNTSRNMLKKSCTQNKHTCLYDYEDDIKYNIMERNSYYIPEKLLEEKEFIQELNEYINHLDPDDRYLLYLKYTNNCTLGQIARHLDLKEGTVKSRLFRVKAKLLKKLDAEMKRGIKP
jgi:RNA polymerase sigma factor, sigma-70 family